LKIVNRVNTKFLGVIVFLFLVGLAINTIAKPHPPGLSEVLSGSKSSLDLNFFLLGLCALSLTTLTLAKSYQMLSRKKELLPQRSGKEEILTEENARLISFNRGLQQENENLKRIRRQLEGSLAERLGNEDLLKRELAKLLSEKKKPEIIIAKRAKKSKVTKKRKRK
jgi:hypothetical protein